MPAGGRDEEGMGGTGERGAQEGGGTVVSSGGRGETRGSDKTGICIGMDMLKFRLLFSHYK